MNENIKKILMGEMNISHGSEMVVKVHKADTHCFIEPNSVSYKEELLQHVYMANIEDLEDELKRINNNNKRYGVRVQYVSYEELSQQRIIDNTNNTNAIKTL